MSDKECSFRLNDLVKYSTIVTSIDKGQIEVFMNGLRLDIANNVKMKTMPQIIFRDPKQGSEIKGHKVEDV